MTLAVTVRYSTTPNGYPGCVPVIRIESASDPVADVKAQIQGQHPSWYNLQIVKIEHR